MKKFNPFISLLFMAGFVLLFNACSKPTNEQTQEAPQKESGKNQRLVVALKPDKDPDKMLQERDALAAYLKSKAGKDVEIIIPTSGAVIQEGLANGTIDLAYLSSTDMVLAKSRKSAEILLAGQIDGKTTYESYWVVLKDKPYQSINDLKGKPVAFSSKTSTSGGIVPIHNLIQTGLVPANGKPEDFFGEGNVWYGSGYVSAVDRVLSGEAEAAAVSYYVLDKDKHLSPDQRSKLRKLQAQGPVPTHVLAIRSTISPEQKAQLKDILRGMNAAEYQSLRDKVFTSELVEVDADAHLAPIEGALSSTAHLK